MNTDKRENFAQHKISLKMYLKVRIRFPSWACPAGFVSRAWKELMPL